MSVQTLLVVVVKYLLDFALRSQGLLVVSEGVE